MPKIINFIAVLALTAVPFMAAPLPAFAQSADENATDSEAPAGDQDLNMGEVVSDEPKPGETYVKEEFGDWVLRCIVVTEGEDPCQMYQLLSDENGAPIAEFTLFRLPEGSEAAAGATIVAPLETSLQEQLGIKVDQGPAKRYPFSFCNTLGCYARIGLTAEDVTAYKRGSAAVLTIVPVAARDQRVTVEMSLEGFTAAFENASILNQ